jgi:hypothetical protein
MSATKLHTQRTCIAQNEVLIDLRQCIKSNFRCFRAQISIILPPYLRQYIIKSVVSRPAYCLKCYSSTIVDRRSTGDKTETLMIHAALVVVVIGTEAGPYELLAPRSAVPMQV